MLPVADSTLETTLDSPLSSASLRYSLRPAVTADGPGPRETRPLGLQFARSIPPPVRPQVRYCHRLQVAVDHDGRPLIERLGWEEDQGKEGETKADSDGVEGPEEDYGWEEQ
jgi:putative ATP-grasp target RiPP